MYALEAAMAAALLARRQIQVPTDPNETFRSRPASDEIPSEGLRSMARLVLAAIVIAAFCLAMQVASHLAAPVDAPRVAIQQAG